MGQPGVSQLELGKVGLPRRRRLESLAAALDFPIGELLARSGWASADLYFREAEGGAVTGVATADVRERIAALLPVLKARQAEAVLAVVEELAASKR